MLPRASRCGRRIRSSTTPGRTRLRVRRVSSRATSSSAMVAPNMANLGYSAPAVISELDKFVFKGPHVERGMPDFTGKLKPEEIEKIKASIQGTADAIRPK